jgi:VWFA-related protein
MRAAIDKERTASYSFLDQVLREKDQAFLIHFDREVEQLQELTNSREKLQKALDGLNSQSFSRTQYPTSPDPNDPNSGQNDPNSGGGNRQGGRRGFGGGTTLYDAVFLASDEVLKTQQGRKSIILLSDGEDRGSKVSLERAIESAQRANVIVYTIYYQGQNNFGRGGDHDGGHHGGMGYPGGGYPGGRGGGWPGGGVNGGGGGRRGSEEPRVDGKKIMERIARETGGRMFEAKKDDSVQQAYTEIQDDLRHQYSLGYTPDKWQSGYHKLEVTTKKKDTKIQAREGYYAGE